MNRQPEALFAVGSGFRMWRWPANKQGAGAHSESLAWAWANATNPYLDAFSK